MNVQFRFAQNDDNTEFTMNSETIKKKFDFWIKNRDPKWIENSRSENIIIRFCEAFDGLDAVVDEDSKLRLITLLKPRVYEAKYN